MSVFTTRLSRASAHLAHCSRLPLCSHPLCFTVTDPRTSLYQTRRMYFWCVPCPRFLIRVVRNAQHVLGVCVLECLITQPRLHLSSPCSKSLVMAILCWSKQTCAKLYPNYACRLPWFSSSWCPPSACSLRLARRLCSPADKPKRAPLRRHPDWVHYTGSGMYHLVHVLVTKAIYPIIRSSIASNSCIYQCDSFRNETANCYSPLITT